MASPRGLLGLRKGFGGSLVMGLSHTQNERVKRCQRVQLTRVSRILGLSLFLFAAAQGSATAAKETTRAAVAANFQVTMTQLVKSFEAGSSYDIQISTGSTGALYAQIVHGAPFDLFFAADQERPRRLVAERYGVPGSRKTYARGRIVLWNGGKGKDRPDCLRMLKSLAFDRLAIANPTTAPYGLAAKQTMDKLGLWQTATGKLVRGSNISQAYQFVMTGNAKLGFVALSQIAETSLHSGECRWLVPESFHAPIEQQRVLLRRGKSNVAARAFLSYLNGNDAKTIIRQFGYGID